MINSGFITGRFKENSTLIIGKFDGLHIGHVALMDYAKNIAKINNSAVGILTFDPNPIEFFQKNSNSFYLTSLQDKVAYTINICKIDFVYVVKFNHDFANLSCDQFICEILKKKLNVKCVVVGENYRFGANQQGDATTLKKIGEKYDIEVESFVLKKHESQKIISSGLIREFLEKGNIIQANALLGRKFQITGVVIRGSQIAGNQLKHKTANLFTEIEYVKIKYGVYAVFAYLNGVKYPAIANFGIKPTFNHKTPHLEVHILKQDLIDFYGARLSIEFIDYIREEKKFDSIDELKNQIYKDCELAFLKINNLAL